MPVPIYTCPLLETTTSYHNERPMTCAVMMMYSAQNIDLESTTRNMMLIILIVSLVNIVLHGTANYTSEDSFM